MRVPATLPTALLCVMGLELSPIQKLYTSSMSGRRLLEHCWEATRQCGRGHLQPPWTPLSPVVQEDLRHTSSLQFLLLQLSNWSFQLLWEIVHVPDVQTALPKPHLASELSISPIPAVGMKTLFCLSKDLLPPSAVQIPFFPYNYTESCVFILDCKLVAAAQYKHTRRNSGLVYHQFEFLS